MAAVLDDSVGLAVFVKTPGLSPIKTRLAADIGAAAAAVYEESLAATTALLHAAEARYPALKIYWAVGESAAVTDRRWAAFATIWTGGGGLGRRLHRVYLTLKRRHRRVILIGSDCPQLTLAELEAAATATEQLVIGPATDGGFYLFAADWRIPRRCWQAVEYSRADTAKQLLAQFPDRQPLMLPAYTDIDDLPSLRRAVTEWRRHDAAAAARLARLGERPVKIK